MTNQDREFNRTCMTEHIHKGVRYDCGIGLTIVADTDLAMFEASVLSHCDLVGLESIKSELYDEMRLIKRLEETVLQTHLGIHEMELFRSAYRSNEYYFRIAKNQIRAKIRLTKIYIDKEWGRIERSQITEHFEDYMNPPDESGREPDPCEVPDFEGNYNCPFDSNGPDDCRRHCGAGVDE